MSASLLSSAQSLLASLLALARTRLELFSTELQEALTRLFFTLVGAVTVLLFAALGAGFAALAVVIAVDEAYRASAAAFFAIAFLALALAAAWTLRRLAGEKRLLADSVSELDRDALLARSTVQRGEVVAALSPLTAKLDVADRVVAGVRSALGWALRLMPIYSLLLRRRR
jgi:uncharacterized membrane protein YqjE